MGAFGLQTHIWNNNLKSILLLAGFPVLLLLLMFGLSFLIVGVSSPIASFTDGAYQALDLMGQSWIYAFLAAGAWFAIAWLFHQKMIEVSTRSRSLTREEAPKAYNLLENLCISQGMTMPKLNIIESEALNAFASGVSEKNYTVTLTRGLMKRLNRDELEAVIAHELTHIQNRDVRLLIISVIFVGIFSFIGEMLFRGFFRTGRHIGGYTRSRNGDSRGGGLLIIVAIVMVGVAYFLAMVIRFTLSRKREFLADAGAVELTRNPDAMISALEKISGRSNLEAPADVQQMMIDNAKPFAGLFMTHPPIEKRIATLQAYGGQDAYGQS